MVERRLSSYELVKLLGEGGMARVYLARDVRLGREVAVKVLAEQLAQRQGFRDRFLREARLAAALDHPNIVPIYDYGDENALFLVMPYVSGGSLQQLIREGPMPSARVATYGTQITDALAYAHQRNVVHRDVKPANILLHADGRLMLSDFGLAKILNGPVVKRNRPDAGTPEYMAPEQIEGQSDPRADIYGLGVVLYLLLTGRLPFTGSTPGAVMEGHLSRLPERPRKVNRAVTPAMEAVVLRALSKHPDDRYQTATEMGAALLAAVVAGDAEPLPFLNDDGGTHVSLPPWLSGPSVPVTRSMPALGAVAPLPILPQVLPSPSFTVDAAAKDSALVDATQPVGIQPPRRPNTTHMLPTLPIPTPPPPYAGSVPGSALGSGPSFAGRMPGSNLGGIETDEQGWSQTTDRRAAQQVAAQMSQANQISQMTQLAQTAQAARHSAAQGTSFSPPQVDPSYGSQPPSPHLTPRIASTMPPATSESDAPSSAAVEREGGGPRLLPTLVMLLLLLALAVGALVLWITAHPLLPH